MTNDLKLSVFSTLQSYESKPLSLDTILWWIRQDQSVAEKTDLYRSMARTITPDEAKKKVKEAMMPAFSVAVTFKDRGRQTQHVAYVTGLSLCDIDHHEAVDEVFERLKADPHTLLCYKTISGEGLRIIYRYTDEHGQPPENALLYRAAYAKGNTYFAQLAGKDYDGQCGDLTRLSGMAHDAEAYYNPEAVAFTVSDAEAAEANLDPSTEPGKPRKVSLVMKNLGYRSQRNSQGCFYRVFEMKPDEQQAVLAANGKAEAVDNQRDTTEQALPF